MHQTNESITQHVASIMGELNFLHSHFSRYKSKYLCRLIIHRFSLFYLRGLTLLWPLRTAVMTIILSYLA